jgi:hypothetical protein
MVSISDGTLVKRSSAPRLAGVSAAFGATFFVFQSISNFPRISDRVAFDARYRTISFFRFEILFLEMKCNFPQMFNRGIKAPIPPATTPRMTPQVIERMLAPSTPASGIPETSKAVVPIRSRFLTVVSHLSASEIHDLSSARSFCSASASPSFVCLQRHLIFC